MDIVITIVCVVLIIAAVFLLIVCIPIAFGKLFLRWSNRRVRYIFSESMSTIIGAAVGALILTGLVLLIGTVFKQQWAFSGGLLIVYTFWIAIKAVKENIQNSRRM